jgi:hypothetical protein
LAASSHSPTAIHLRVDEIAKPFEWNMGSGDEHGSVALTPDGIRPGVAEPLPVPNAAERAVLAKCRQDASTDIGLGTLAAVLVARGSEYHFLVRRLG